MSKVEIDWKAIENFAKSMQATNKVVQKMVKIDDITEEELSNLVDLYPEWQTGVALKIGDIVNYNNKLYEVIQAHTTQADWLPSAVASLYKEISPKVTEGGEEIIPEFKQPTGAHDAYKLGDKVLFNGKVYESIIDNNAYSPTAYPAGWKEIKGA